MTKRFFTVCFLLLLTVCLGAAAFTLETEALPSSVILTWNEVEDAVYYDIYNEDNFIVRLDSSKRSYTVKHLLSETRYDFSIAARTEDNATLAAAFADETTTIWDGLHRTDISLKAKCVYMCSYLTIRKTHTTMMPLNRLK